MTKNKIFYILDVLVLLLSTIGTILFNLLFYFNFNLLYGILGYISLIVLSLCFILSDEWMNKL